MATLGISTLFLQQHNRPFTEVIEELNKERPFEERVDHWELVDDGAQNLFKERLQQIREVKGSKTLSIHAPFERMDIASVTTDRRKESLKHLKSSVDSAAELEAIAWTFHPGPKPRNPEDLAESRSLNRESIVHLFEYASDRGIRASLENLFPSEFYFNTTPSEFIEFMEEESIKLNVTFDVGHANIENRISGFVEKLLDRVLEIHFTDNRGSNDDHHNIGDGSIDWNYLFHKLRTKEFNGIAVVEAMSDPMKSLTRLRKEIKESKFGIRL